MHRNKSVNVHQFAMVPRAEIPRSRFDMQSSHKTTFDAGGIYPVWAEEVLPGDTFSMHMTAFARMSTPIFPVMDNMYMDTFFFFVPNRLVWDNWQRFMGERLDPDDTIDFLVPQCVSSAGGFPPLSVMDYLGMPTQGQVDPLGVVSVNALYLRAYNLIWNEWFRDENLQDRVAVPTGDGPDPTSYYAIFKRGKRHDYFTSCLPWPQKGNAVTLEIGPSAPVMSPMGVNTYLNVSDTSGQPYVKARFDYDGGTGPQLSAEDMSAPVADFDTGLYADLSLATAVTVNQLRQSFQIQKLLERDARGGTRYTEILQAHFGVKSPDARLQRPEYLGGGTVPVNVTPVPQTSGTGSYTDTPLGNIGAFGTVLNKRNGFTQSFTEHGIILGLISVRADLNYQQGLHRKFSRRTRYDYYFPVFAALGEQAVLQKEIYMTGIDAEDEKVFGYQERWAEYRYGKSQISGLFKSTTTGTIDAWHLAQRFTVAPTLNTTFIQESPPMERVIAVGPEALGQQFIGDFFFDCKATRAMPVYSVPGMIDHF